MVFNLIRGINRVEGGPTKIGKIYRNFYSFSEKEVREYKEQLSKFNGKCDDYESKIDAARSIALAVLSDEKISLNTPPLAERNRKQILYNVTGGRHWRFKICYNTYQKLAPKSMLTNEHLLRVAIMGYLGEQNDYYDRYGNRTGKMLDEDIKNGKLSWMVLKAYEHANTDQRKILRECYGNGDAKSIPAVIDVYEQIGMKDIVEAFKKEAFESISRRIKELPDPRFQDAILYPLQIIKGWYTA